MTSYTRETKYYKAHDGRTFTTESDCQNYEKFLDAKDRLKEMEDQWWKEQGLRNSGPCLCKYSISPMRDDVAILLGMFHRVSNWYLFWPLTEKDLEYCNTFKAVLDLDPDMQVTCKINEFQIDRPYIIVTGAWDAVITTPALIEQNLNAIIKDELRDLNADIDRESHFYIDSLRQKLRIAETKAKTVKFEGTEI